MLSTTATNYSQTATTNATNYASLYLSFSSFTSFILPISRSPSRTPKLVQPSSNFSACATYAIDRFLDPTDTAKPDESSRGDERRGKSCARLILYRPSSILLSPAFYSNSTAAGRIFGRHANGNLRYACCCCWQRYACNLQQLVLLAESCTNS